MKEHEPHYLSAAICSSLAVPSLPDGNAAEPPSLPCLVVAVARPGPDPRVAREEAGQIRRVLCRVRLRVPRRRVEHRPRGRPRREEGPARRPSQQCRVPGGPVGGGGSTQTLQYTQQILYTFNVQHILCKMQINVNFKKEIGVNPVWNLPQTKSPKDL